MQNQFDEKLPNQADLEELRKALKDHPARVIHDKPKE